MDLSVITVTHNSKEYIAEQIRSVLFACGKLELEQIVVDNGSTDDTGTLVKASFTNVKVLENEVNIGFGAANNQGYETASGEYILFLNPDMQLLEQNSMERAVEWMKVRPEVGIMGCKLVNSQGGSNRKEDGPRRFPKFWEQLILLLKLPHLFPGLLNSHCYSDLDLTQEQEVDSVRGAFMLVRRSVIEQLGQPFDPRYFIWYEDVDLCREAKQMGFRVMYNPAVRCVDFVGQSFKKQDLYSKQRVLVKSMISYFRKWEPWWQGAILYIVGVVDMALAWLYTQLFVHV